MEPSPETVQKTIQEIILASFPNAFAHCENKRVYIKLRTQGKDICAMRTIGSGENSQEAWEAAARRFRLLL